MPTKNQFFNDSTYTAMTYENQLKELAEKMAREHFGAFYTTNHVYTDMFRPLAAIALAFTADKVKEALNIQPDEWVEQYLKHKGFIN